MCNHNCHDCLFEPFHDREFLSGGKVLLNFFPLDAALSGVVENGCRPFEHFLKIFGKNPKSAGG